jgi:hypothetical protein
MLSSAQCPGKKNWGRGSLIVCGMLMEVPYDAGSDVEIRRWCLIHNFLNAFQPAWIKLQCFFGELHIDSWNQELAYCPQFTVSAHTKAFCHDGALHFHFRSLKLC